MLEWVRESASVLPEKISTFFDRMVDAVLDDKEPAYDDINLYEPMDTHVILGRVYHHLGNLKKALEHFQKAEEVQSRKLNQSLTYLYGIWGLWYSEMMIDESEKDHPDKERPDKERKVMERVAWSMRRYESQPQRPAKEGVDLLVRAADLLALGKASLQWERTKGTGAFDDARRALRTGSRKNTADRPVSARTQRTSGTRGTLHRHRGMGQSTLVSQPGTLHGAACRPENPRDR